MFNNKIVIFSIVQAEKAKAVREIKEKEMLSWSYNTTIDGTYTGIEFTYTDPDKKGNDKNLKITIGKKGRMYFANDQATSKYDAELQAKALLNKANREIETMSVKIIADNSIVAGQCVKISGLKNVNGKYYVDQIKHSVGSGYTMQMEMHKVQEAVK